MLRLPSPAFDGWQKSTFLWGTVGIVLALVCRIPVTWCAAAILLGSATGLVQAWFFARGRHRAADLTPLISILGFVAVLMVAVDQKRFRTFLGLAPLALGAFHQACWRLVSGLMVMRALKAARAAALEKRQDR